MRTQGGVSIPDAWGPYLTQQFDGFEMTHLPLWFTRTFNPTGLPLTLSLNFFDQALATLDLFNAIFPIQFSYKVYAIGVHFRVRPRNENSPTAGANFAGVFDDIVQITDLGRLSWSIGTKNYGPFPLWKLGAGAGVSGIINGNATSYAQLGDPASPSLYTLKIPLVIPAQTQVSFIMDWPQGAIATTTANIPITLCLEGETARPIQ